MLGGVCASSVMPKTSPILPAVHWFGNAPWHMGASQFTPVPGALAAGLRVSIMAATKPFGSLKMLKGQVLPFPCEPTREKHVTTLMPQSKPQAWGHAARARFSGWSIEVSRKASTARPAKGPERRAGRPAHPGGARWASEAGLEPEFGDHPPGHTARSRGRKNSASEVFIDVH